MAGCTSCNTKGSAVALDLGATPGTPPDQLSLADLPSDQERRGIFESTLVTVGEQATLAEAKSTMIARPCCSDVFVTKLGNRTEAVLGWLTNVDIARST